MTTPRGLLRRVAALEAAHQPGAALIPIIDLHAWPDAERDAGLTALEGGDAPAFAALVERVEGTAPPVRADGGVGSVIIAVHPDRYADWLESRHLSEAELDRRDAERDRADRLAALPPVPPPDPEEMICWDRRGEPVTRAEVASGLKVCDFRYGVPGMPVRLVGG